jgi:hypothetical protein
MSKNKGFFSEIKNQIKTGIGLVITAGFGLLIANIPPSTKDTIVISKTIKIEPVKPKKEEGEITW